MALLALAEADVAVLRGLDRSAAFARFEGEHEDYLAALAMFLDGGCSAEAARLASAIAPLWIATGRLDEGSEWLKRVLPARSADVVRKQLCIEAAFLFFWRGEDRRAGSLFEE